MYFIIPPRGYISFCAFRGTTAPKLVFLFFSVCATANAQSTASFDIQAALDALPEGGGIVRVPAGKHEIAAPLVIRQGDVRLEGAGAATHIINRNTQGEPAVLVQHKDLPNNPRDKNARLWRVTLANFRVSGAKESGDGIRAEAADEIYLHGLAVDHHGGNGIVLRDCFEDARLIGNIITYNAAAGVLIEKCHDIVVSANQIEENQDALRCLDSFNLCMTGNNVDDHLRHGIVVENTYGSIVSGNMIEECQGTAVILDRDCYGITISANTIAHHFGGGVHLLDAWGCVISGNTFPVVHGDAIRVGPNSGRLTISGNNFSNSYVGEGKQKRPATDKQPQRRDGGTGIVLDRTSDVAITGNTFGGLTTPAVIAQNGCRRLLITNNIIVDVNRVATDKKSIDADDAKESIVKDNIGG